MKQRTGLPCPTCGMTTCVLAFARGEVLTAFYVQPAGGFLCSLLVVVAFFAFLTSVFGVYFGFFDRLLARTEGQVHGCRSARDSCRRMGRDVGPSRGGTDLSGPRRDRSRWGPG